MQYTQVTLRWYTLNSGVTVFSYFLFYLGLYMACMKVVGSMLVVFTLFFFVTSLVLLSWKLCRDQGTDWHDVVRREIHNWQVHLARYVSSIAILLWPGRAFLIWLPWHLWQGIQLGSVLYLGRGSKVTRTAAVFVSRTRDALSGCTKHYRKLCTRTGHFLVLFVFLSACGF